MTDSFFKKRPSELMFDEAEKVLKNFSPRYIEELRSVLDDSYSTSDEV